MKSQTIYCLLYFCLISPILYCQKSNLDVNKESNNTDFSTMNIEVGFGLPFGVSQEIKNFTKDSMNLDSPNKISTDITFRLRSPSTEFSGIMGVTSNIYNFSSSNIELRYDFFYGYAGFGYGAWIKNRLYIGGDIHFGVMSLKTSLSNNTEVSDIYYGYENNSYNEINTQSNPRFNFGITPQLLLKINKKIQLYTKSEILLINSRKLGELNTIDIFSTITNIIFGVRIAINQL